MMKVAAQRSDQTLEPRQGGSWSIVHVARRIGVSTSTLRSWEHRYGLRPSARTRGGHRRYTVSDIANLQRIARLIASGTPAAVAAATRPRRVVARGATPQTRPEPARALTEGFVRAADTLDSATQARAAEKLLAAHGAVESWTAAFAPYLRALGRRWEGTGTGIECEHITVGVLQAVLDRHTWNQHIASTAPTVLLSTAAGELHTLPLHAAAAALAERNVRTRMLDRVPVSAIHAAVGTFQPSAVLIWAQRDETTDSNLLNELSTAAPIVYAAGPGWTGMLIPETVVCVNDLADLTDHVDSWAR